MIFLSILDIYFLKKNASNLFVTRQVVINLVENRGVLEAFP
jgi:hypothetical protein